MRAVATTMEHNFENQVLAKLELLGRGIDSLRGNMGDLRGDLGDLRGDVGNLREDLGGLRGDVGNLREDLGSLRGDVGDLREDLSDLRGEVGELRGDLGIFRDDYNKAMAGLSRLILLIDDHVHRLFVAMRLLADRVTALEKQRHSDDTGNGKTEG